MTRDELTALLDKREAQVREARKTLPVLGLGRPTVHSETLRSACDDLSGALAACRDLLATPGEHEEAVKATLLDRYIEFCRCRDRLVAL